MHLKKIMPKTRKGALELSIGTIVVIVLGISMLILGLVLVRNIFRGATTATDIVDDAVKNELNKLFNDPNTKSIVYLSGGVAEIEVGNDYNLDFGIKNVLRGEEGTAAQFSYQITATEVEQGCGITLADADGLIVVGRSGGPLTITPGADPTERTVLLRATEGFPLCTMTYDLVVTKNGEPYDTNFFIVSVVS